MASCPFIWISIKSWFNLDSIQSTIQISLRSILYWQSNNQMDVAENTTSLAEVESPVHSWILQDVFIHVRCLYSNTRRNIILVQLEKQAVSTFPIWIWHTSHNLIKTRRQTFDSFHTSQVLDNVWCTLGFHTLDLFYPILMSNTLNSLRECVPADWVMVLEMESGLQGQLWNFVPPGSALNLKLSLIWKSCTLLLPNPQ